MILWHWLIPCLVYPFMPRPPAKLTLFPYTTLFRSARIRGLPLCVHDLPADRTPHRRRHVPLARSEEHTSELQSRGQLVCRLLLEKKKTLKDYRITKQS